MSNMILTFFQVKVFEVEELLLLFITFFSLCLYSAKVSFSNGYLLKESTSILTEVSLFIIVSFICTLEIIGKDGKQKIGKNNKTKREFLNFTKFLIN